ncbi:MAG: phage portal protein [Candidatus Paracaedibacteraceae bacterium]|nr:phage portal protein [Candidatus Paracaedibacteraceae bacterium]
MNILKSWWPQRTKQKSSSVASYIAYNTLGKPVWTPRNYALLADEGYQKNVIVYRCVTLIARGVGSVPWLLYHKDHEVDRHPILELLNCPSPRQAGSSFMEAVVGHLLLSGNAYIEAVFDQRNQARELYALRPDRMKVIPGISGMPTGFEYEIDGYKRRLECDPITGHSSVLHLKNFHPLNDWYGMSPIEAAARSIDQHNVVAEHNLSLLQNGGRPSGALMFKPGNSQPLSEKQRDSLREDIRRIYEGNANAGRIMVLEGDFDWKEMGLSPKDLDFIEGKKMSAREIAQAFGVPPMLVGIAGDATFANYKEARYHLWEDTILPLMEFLIAELNLWLCPYFGEGYRLSYDVDAIPALAQRRESLWNKIQSADFLTLNEKRQAVGYGPLPNGDTLTVNPNKETP